MEPHKVTVNRAPVLTLWAAVVAERLGFRWEEALTLGRAVAGLNAQSKGRALGMFRPGEVTGRPGAPAAPPEGEFHVELLGRAVPSVRSPEGVRALEKGKPSVPARVERYLQGKLGDALPAVREAMTELAAAFTRDELEEAAYGLYERFRPAVARGASGWGQAGELDLDLIRSLAPRP
jgi:hypothetical protein